MFRTIIVPIDMAQKEKAARMVEAAGQLADEGGKIVLLNVMERVSLYELPEFSAELQDNWIKEARDALEEIAGKSKVEAKVEVRTGHAAMTIIELAKDLSADAIVIASHRPGLQDYFLGSTAARVVRHAPCSVLVLR